MQKSKKLKLVIASAIVTFGFATTTIQVHANPNAYQKAHIEYLKQGAELYNKSGSNNPEHRNSISNKELLNRLPNLSGVVNQLEKKNEHNVQVYLLDPVSKIFIDYFPNLLIDRLTDNLNGKEKFVNDLAEKVDAKTKNDLIEFANTQSWLDGVAANKYTKNAYFAAYRLFISDVLITEIKKVDEIETLYDLGRLKELSSQRCTQGLNHEEFKREISNSLRITFSTELNNEKMDNLYKLLNGERVPNFPIVDYSNKLILPAREVAEQYGDINFYDQVLPKITAINAYLFDLYNRNPGLFDGFREFMVKMLILNSNMRQLIAISCLQFGK
ncbi:MAG: hypothetical protein LBF82_00465 [Lactobacillales bacterium]|nr:hypothetical protein [Lactobacillales bacterium]